MLMLPELCVVATAFVVLLADLFLTDRQRGLLTSLALIGLACAGAAVVRLMPAEGALLGGRFAVDAVTWWFKLLFLLAALITVALSSDALNGRVTARASALASGGEYYTLLLFTVCGMLFLVSARDLITLYVSLELATIPLFALAGWRRDTLGGEAGLKYVIIGAGASALLIYGLSVLFGLSGTTRLAEMAAVLKPGPAFWLAAGMVTAGVGFKMTIVPFHMWAADVYQGAPTPITAYLSVASKCAGLALIFQLFFRVLGASLEDWAMPIALFATATMTLGNTVAIVQQNIKRFMAFSAISQAGYLLMGFLGPAAEGVPAMVFYMLVYVATNLAAFTAIVWFSNETGGEEIRDYRGLARTNPRIALAFMIALFSLAGIPPLSGFVGKFFLFSIAAKAGFHWLVAVAAVNSTISLYYYLRVVRQMYIEPALPEAKPLPISPLLGATLVLTVIATVVLGIVPAFYQLIHTQTLGWLAALPR